MPSTNYIQCYNAQNAKAARSVKQRGPPHTHLSLADVSTLLADNAIHNGPMVKPVNKCATRGAHKRVLQSTKQDSVQLLYIVLICPLKEQDNRKKKDQITGKKVDAVS